MVKKVAPPAEKFASCPYDEKVLDFYKGTFDCVYVLLHPFLRPKGKNQDINWGKKHEVVQAYDYVLWQEVLNSTDLKSISEIDIGLRTSIGGIKKENKTFAESLNKFAKITGIECPSEGGVPPLLEDRILKAVKSLGHEWLWLGDEHGFERKLEWVDDIIKGDMIPPSGCIFTHDHSILITTHWDSHCSFLCGSQKDINKILEHHKFEGFFCTDKTEVYWGLHDT